MQGADLAFVWYSKGKAMGVTELVLTWAWLLTPVLGTGLICVFLFLTGRVTIPLLTDQELTYKAPTRVQLKKNLNQNKVSNTRPRSRTRRPRRQTT